MKPIIAICYDFDGTLSPGSMQEYNFIPALGLRPKKFWEMVGEASRRQDGDEILTYMGLMLKEASKHDDVKVTKKEFIAYGKRVRLFPGVDGWFARIDRYVKRKGARIEHYIISSGIREMIEGTTIFHRFKKVYASSFAYDKHGAAIWPALAINYTTKTQFLFKINKGILDISDSKRVNEFIPENERRVPFSRMVFIGDGLTDIPCMKLVKSQGGFSLAVYRWHTSKSIGTSKQLLKNGRVNAIAPADYRQGKRLEIIVKRAIDKIIADHLLMIKQ